MSIIFRDNDGYLAKSTHGNYRFKIFDFGSTMSDSELKYKLDKPVVVIIFELEILGTQELLKEYGEYTKIPDFMFNKIVGFKNFNTIQEAQDFMSEL